MYQLCHVSRYWWLLNQRYLNLEARLLLQKISPTHIKCNVFDAHFLFLWTVILLKQNVHGCFTIASVSSRKSHPFSLCVSFNMSHVLKLILMSAQTIVKTDDVIPHTITLFLWDCDSERWVLSHSLNTEEVKKILNIQTVYLLLYFILYCVTVFLYCISDFTQWLLSFCL